MLQKLQGADTSAGRESAGLQRGLQGKTAEEKRAQVEDHSRRRGGHRVGSAEQGADRAVAEGSYMHHTNSYVAVLLLNLMLRPCFG